MYFFPLDICLDKLCFLFPPSRSLKPIVHFDYSGIIQGWILNAFVICITVNHIPHVFLSAAWVWSNLSARDVDLRSEQPSEHLTIFSIWFQAQLLSIWPKLFLAKMNLSSKARRTSTNVNVTDKVSKGLNLDPITEILRTVHGGYKKTQQCVLAEWMNGRSCCRGSDQKQLWRLWSLNH